METHKNFELNAYALPIREMSNGVHYRFLIVKGENWNKPQLALLIDEDTRKTHVYNAWEEIEILRGWCLNEFGSDLNRNSAIVLLEINHLHERGFGYGEIAKILNYRSIALICCAYYDKEDIKSNIGWGLTGLIDLFFGLGLGFERFRDEVELGLESLSEGRTPWKLENGPFERRRIRDQLDYFRERIKKGQIVIKPHPLDSDVNVDDAYLLVKGWYEKANELLQKSDRSHWKRRQDWIKGWLDLLHEQVYASANQTIVKFRDENGG